MESLNHSFFLEFETYKMNHPELSEEHLITGDICLEENKQKLIKD